MTAKEKAEELVRKYYTFGLNNPAQSFSWYECKECALIAVDYLMKEAEISSLLDYWFNVKQEIQKL